MVSIPTGRKTSGETCHTDQTPCLEHLKLKQAGEGIFTPGGSNGSKHGFQV